MTNAGLRPQQKQFQFYCKYKRYWSGRCTNPIAYKSHSGGLGKLLSTGSEINKQHWNVAEVALGFVASLKAKWQEWWQKCLLWSNVGDEEGQMFNLFCGLTGPGNRTNAVFHGCLWFKYMLIHPLADNCIYWLWGAYMHWQGRGQGILWRQSGLCLCKWPHLDSPSLFSGNKHTPKLLLNTPTDGSTVYQTEPPIKAITGQMIERGAFFVIADWM